MTVWGEKDVHCIFCGFEISHNYKNELLKNLIFRFRDEPGLSRRILAVVIKACKKLIILIEGLDILNLNGTLIIT